jgi:hypothetical protein
MITNGPPNPEPSLSAELAQVDQECPHWHAYCTGTRCWAVTSHTPWPGGGATVDAPTPPLLLHEIAKQLKEWQRDRPGWAA